MMLQHVARLPRTPPLSMARHLWSQPRATLQEVMVEKVREMRAEVRDVRARFGDRVLDTCTVNQAYGGMRDVKLMTYETSLVTDSDGVRFRGLTVPECRRLLPKAPLGEEPLPEALLWLLLTGDIPSKPQINSLRDDLATRARVPRRVLDGIDALRTTLHPVSQFSAAVLMLQQDSVMAAEYATGRGYKSEYWKYCLEDVLTLIARLPEVAARIYRRSFADGRFFEADHDGFDMGANFARMMGFDDPQFDELMRCLIFVLSDHEGGSVSSHTMRLVGSTLSDPYLAFSGALNGLAGPLHGLAPREVHRWMAEVRRKLGGQPASKENLTALCWERLNAGRVIPGFGHSVLRGPDPRCTILREFAQQHFPDDEQFRLMLMLGEVVPEVLQEHGKVKNPFANVDGHTGVLLSHYGLTEANYYTVIFGLSRAISLSSLVWDRALMLPVVHPLTVSTAWLKQNFEKGASPTEKAGTW